jgi:transposase
VLLRLLEERLATLNSFLSQPMKTYHETVPRMARVPGVGIDSPQQIIAEVGVTASSYSSASRFHLAGATSPGKEESAEQSYMSRSAKGNRHMRRILKNANRAARSTDKRFQIDFSRILPHLGYQSTLCAIAHRLSRVVWKVMYEGDSNIEQGVGSEPQTQAHRARRISGMTRTFRSNLRFAATNPSPHGSIS